MALDDGDDTGTSYIDGSGNQPPAVGAPATPAPQPQSSTGSAQAGLDLINPLAWNQQAGGETAPQGQSDIGKAGVAYKGMTDAGLQKSGALFGKEEAKGDKEIGALAATRNALADRYNAGYQDRASAVKEEADIESAHQASLVDLYHRQMDFNQHAADLEMRAAAEAKADQTRLLGAYQEQLAGVRQLMMTTGNPLAGMTGSENVALGFARFAQGFLAPAGIKLDVNDQIDRWVERGMQEHQQMIQNARTAAGDTMHLYEIARQSSQDDYEARQRYRGFVIEGMKTAVLADSARYNSQIATARAKEAVANLDIEQTKTFEALNSTFFQQSMAVKAQRIDSAYKQGMLALESQKVDLEKQKLAATAAKTTLQMKLVADPGDVIKDAAGKVISGGKFKWSYDPKDAYQQKTVLDATTSYDLINNQVNHLRDLRVKIANQYGPDWYKRMKSDSEPWVEWNNARSQVVAEIQKSMTGLQANEAEAKRFSSMLEDDKFLGGSRASEVDQVGQWMREKFQSVMDHVADKLPDRDALDKEAADIKASSVDLEKQAPVLRKEVLESRRGMLTQRAANVVNQYNKLPANFEPYDKLVTANPKEKALDDARFGGNLPTTGPIAADLGVFGARDTNAPEDVREGKSGGNEGGLSPAYFHFAQMVKDQHPEQAPSLLVQSHGAVSQTRAVGAVDDLAIHAVQGDKEAVTALSNIANGMVLGKAVPSNAQHYASWVLQEISHHNPKTAASFFGSRVSGDTVNSLWVDPTRGMTGVQANAYRQTHPNEFPAEE